MELWIRSQDRTKLIKVDILQIINNEEDKELPFYINTSYELLGAYKTKERALEVLDEIQKIIKWCQNDMRDVAIGDMQKLKGCFDDCVYEMPKE